MIKEGVELVAHFEGFRARPYLCAAGVWTIGEGTTRYPTGRRVRGTDPDCTREQARAWLTWALEQSEKAVLRLTTPPLNDKQLAALASFVYNLGSGAFRASTLRRRINSGDFDDVPYQLSRWNKGGGRVLRGLVLRRDAEARLWLEGCAKS